MFRLLREIYEKAESECTIGISFSPAANGAQINPCRSLLVTHAGTPTIDSGRSLAARLASVTTKRSGLGLLFLICGREGLEHKVVISRFRANNGVLVDETPDAFSVEFIDRVFMKNAHSYKAVLYKHTSLAAGFWSGFAVDKQIASRDMETSNYWVKEFLDSDFMTTPAMGTRRLALALRDASQKSGDLEVRKQITAAATLAHGINGLPMTTHEFCERFGFSDSTREAIVREFSRSELANDSFEFSAVEFAAQLPYRTIELDSGAMLTANSASFDNVFERQIVDPKTEKVRFSATGKIVVEKLEKSS